MFSNIRADKKHYDELEDHFLKHLGFEYSEFLCEELDRQGAQTMDIVIPDSLNQWFGDFLKQERKRKKIQVRKIQFMKHSKRAAIFIMFLLGMNYILVSNVDAYRVKWINTVTHIMDRFTQIDFIIDSQDANSLIPKDWGGYYYLTYLPAGYKLTDTRKSDSIAVLVYTDDQGKQLIFSQNKQNSATRIDSEKGIVEKVLLKGNTEAYYLEKGSSKLLIWFWDDTSFQINSNKLDMEELIQIAENVEFNNNLNK